MKYPILVLAVTSIIYTVIAESRSPSNFDPFHTHCEIDFTIDGYNCAYAKGPFYYAISNLTDITNPPGKYDYKGVTNSTIWAYRMNANGYHTDDVWFDFNQTSPTTCNIKGKSRAQSFSYYDHNRNYCNIYNLMRMGNAKHTWTNFKVTNCKWAVDEKDQDTVCDAV